MFNFHNTAVIITDKETGTVGLRSLSSHTASLGKEQVFKFSNLDGVRTLKILNHRNRKLICL
jgi:hypothetical protein